MKVGDIVELKNPINIIGTDKTIILATGLTGIVEKLGDLSPDNYLVKFKDQEMSFWLDNFHVKLKKEYSHPHTNIFK